MQCNGATCITNVINVWMCACVCVTTHTHTYIYIYIHICSIYIYIEREIERERERKKETTLHAYTFQDIAWIQPFQLDHPRKCWENVMQIDWRLAGPCTPSCKRSTPRHSRAISWEKTKTPKNAKIVYYVCVSIFISLSLSLSPSPSVKTAFNIYLEYVYIYIFIYLFIHLFIYIFIYLKNAAVQSNNWLVFDLWFTTAGPPKSAR